MKIPKFKTVQARDTYSLDILVNKLLEEGYQLVGQPFVSPEHMICQACILKKETI